MLAALLLVPACRKGERPAAAAPEPGAASSTSPPLPLPHRRAPAAAAGGLVTDKALMDGHLVEVSHSKWDGGQTSDLFDTNKDSLARTEKADPAVVEIHLPEPRPLKGVSVTTGGMDVALTVVVQPATGAAKTYTKEFRQMPPDPTFGSGLRHRRGARAVGPDRDQGPERRGRAHPHSDHQAAVVSKQEAVSSREDLLPTATTSSGRPGSTSRSGRSRDPRRGCGRTDRSTIPVGDFSPSALKERWMAPAAS